MKKSSLSSSRTVELFETLSIFSACYFLIEKFLCSELYYLLLQYGY